MSKYFNKGVPEGVVLEFPIKDSFDKSTLTGFRVGHKHDTKEPLYVSSGDEQFEDVAKVRKIVTKGDWPKEFLIKYGSKIDGAPSVFLKTLMADKPNGRWNPKKAANLVSDNSPYNLARDILSYWGRMGKFPKFDVDTVKSDLGYKGNGDKNFARELQSEMISNLDAYGMGSTILNY